MLAQLNSLGLYKCVKSDQHESACEHISQSSMWRTDKIKLLFTERMSFMDKQLSVSPIKGAALRALTKADMYVCLEKKSKMEDRA